MKVETFIAALSMADPDSEVFLPCSAVNAVDGFRLLTTDRFAVTYISNDPKKILLVPQEGPWAKHRKYEAADAMERSTTDGKENGSAKAE